MSEPGTDTPLLEVDGLTVGFGTPHGASLVVRDVSFVLRAREAVGIVGESGSGKSVTCRALIGLVPVPGEVVAGSIRLEDQEIVGLRERAMRRIRGRRVAMIFQDPAASLNPTFTIGDQLSETLRTVRGMGRRAARDEALALLERVGIAAARERLGSYPHELSGGMRQRTMIALALATDPALLIADEPTTALDVTIQEQILQLLDELRHERDMALVLVSHDLGVIADTCDRVLVMYAGTIVESAPVERLLENARHPYTHALLRARPEYAVEHGEPRLRAIPGQLPDLSRLGPGCVFADRCDRASERCATTSPDLTEEGAGHAVACWHPIEGAA